MVEMVYSDFIVHGVLFHSVAEPEPLFGAGAGTVKRCGSGFDGSGSNNGIKHG
jgi:hypothetical protein